VAGLSHLSGRWEERTAKDAKIAKKRQIRLGGATITRGKGKLDRMTGWVRIYRI